MNAPQTTTWVNTLLDRVNSLAEEFGLDDGQSLRFRDFAIGLAKEQYKIGNKYGASWAFKRAREETAGLGVPAVHNNAVVKCTRI